MDQDNIANNDRRDSGQPEDAAA